MHSCRQVLALGGLALLLGGCMTQQENNAFQGAVLNSLAQGVLSGAGTSIAHGIAMDSKRLIKTGAAAMAAGAVMQGGAAVMQQRQQQQQAMAAATSTQPVRRGAATARSGPGGYPDTPQCRAFWRYTRAASHPGTGLAGQGEAAFARILQMEHECLASAPNHPMSRSRACGGGMYLHRIFPDSRGVCGWRQAVASANARTNTARWSFF